MVERAPIAVDSAKLDDTPADRLGPTFSRRGEVYAGPALYLFPWAVSSVFLQVCCGAWFCLANNTEYGYGSVLAC